MVTAKELSSRSADFNRVAGTALLLSLAEMRSEGSFEHRGRCKEHGQRYTQSLLILADLQYTLESQHALK